MSEKPENKFDLAAKDLRKRILDLYEDIAEMRGIAENLDDHEVHDIGEVHANITLTYRHLEDARMRLGKAIQARDGGVSVYKD